jgi:uncharacterized cupin superfamily protein
MILTRKVAAIVGGVAAVAVIGTAGVAAATAAPSPSGAPSPSASASESPSAPGADKRERGDRRGRFGLHFRGLHGEWVVKGEDGKFVTMVSARGEVTAVSASSITIKAEDGFTATFAVNADTKVRGRDVEEIADVKVGDQGGAVGPKGGDTVTARAVFVRHR